MKRRSIYVFITAALAMLIPSPGRFVYGVTLVLEYNFLIILGTFANNFVKKIKLGELEKAVTLIFVVSGAILFRQIMIIFQPEVILNLGVLFYFIPFSLFFIGYLFSYPEYSLGNKMKFVTSHSFTYSIFALIIFLLRDILGYGTFTFYGPNHQIFEKVIINSDKANLLSFIASIPGAFVLCAIMLFIHVSFRYKYNIFRNAEVVE